MYLADQDSSRVSKCEFFTRTKSFEPCAQNLIKVGRICPKNAKMQKCNGSTLVGVELFRFLFGQRKDGEGEVGCQAPIVAPSGVPPNHRPKNLFEKWAKSGVIG